MDIKDVLKEIKGIKSTITIYGEEIYTLTKEISKLSKKYQKAKTIIGSNNLLLQIKNKEKQVNNFHLSIKTLEGNLKRFEEDLVRINKVEEIITGKKDKTKKPNEFIEGYIQTIKQLNIHNPSLTDLSKKTGITITRWQRQLHTPEFLIVLTTSLRKMKGYRHSKKMDNVELWDRAIDHVNNSWIKKYRYTTNSDGSLKNPKNYSRIREILPKDEPLDYAGDFNKNYPEESEY